MKKFLAILPLVAIVAAIPAFAANSTTTEIIAVVGKTVAITGGLEPTKTIDVTATSTLIGSITIRSNTSGNWTISVTSVNQGVMKGDTTSANYPYRITLAPSSGTPIFENQSIGAGLSTTLTTGIGNITYTLTALYDTAESLGLAADTYRDSITLTVAAL